MHARVSSSANPYNLNGARSLGAPTHPLVSVHKTTGDTWWAPARRLIQNTFGRCCVRQATQILDPSPMAKNTPFFRFGRRA